VVTHNSLASDELQHTGTWTWWDDSDHGRWRYDLQEASNSGYLRARWFARDTQERLKNVLGEQEAMTSPLMAQVMTVEGWSDLLNAESFCEAPAEASGPAVSDDELMAIARTELTNAMGVAQAAGATDYYNWALSGRARANLWLGDYSAALADAQAIPDDFIYYAKYSINGSNNWMVTVSTYGENNAGSVREKWWPQVDTVAEMLRDPYTDELDPRVPIHYNPGDKGVDGITDFYSQWKYQDRGSDIPYTHKGEMKLIEAEVYWRDNDLTNAMAALNWLRTRAGLTAHPTDPMPSADKVFEYFMHEMFAELFVEGRRFGYLDRLGQVEEIFGAMNDPSRPLPRPTKWTLTSSEARYNPEIEDNPSVRCLPMSGSG
ncbi:MAG: RagB/SusD family nutrient uptake outer membrane protein, partial [Gemmatimonadota bacterium]|jgi:hypothetical protein